MPRLWDKLRRDLWTASARPPPAIKWILLGFGVFLAIAVAEDVLEFELGGFRYLIFGLIMAACGATRKLCLNVVQVVRQLPMDDV